MAGPDWRMKIGRRPWWMNALFAFCLYMSFAYMPFDLFWKNVATDEEVWFGLMLHGWAAKLTEPLHWAIYAGGAYGFWKMRPWMWPWAAVYTAQISIVILRARLTLQPWRRNRDDSQPPPTLPASDIR